MSRIVFVILLSSLLTACGGSGGTRRSSENNAPPLTDASRNGFTQVSIDDSSPARVAAASAVLPNPEAITDLPEPGTASILIGAGFAALLAVRATRRRATGARKHT